MAPVLGSAETGCFVEVLTLVVVGQEVTALAEAFELAPLVAELEADEPALEPEPAPAPEPLAAAALGHFWVSVAVIVLPPIVTEAELEAELELDELEDELELVFGRVDVEVEPEAPAPEPAEAPALAPTFSLLKTTEAALELEDELELEELLELEEAWAIEMLPNATTEAIAKDNRILFMRFLLLILIFFLPSQPNSTFLVAQGKE